LQGLRKGVNDGGGGNPYEPSGEQKASDLEEERSFGRGFAEHGPGEVAILPSVKEGGYGSRPEGTVDELVDEDLDRNGRPVWIIAEKKALEPVESIDVDSPAAPIEYEECYVARNHGGIDPTCRP